MYDIASLHVSRQAWLRLSGIPPRFRGLGIEDADLVGVDTPDGILPIAESPIQHWLDGILTEGMAFEYGKGLLLSGTPGVGKTRLLAILLQEVIRKANSVKLGNHPGCLLATPVAFTQFADLMEKRKRMFGLPTDSDEWSKLDHTIEIFNASAGPEYDVRVAGIDDVGKEHTTASRFSEDSLDHLLRRRYDLGYPTLITSNIERKDWGIYGNSMVSFAHEALTEAVIVNRRGDARR